MSVSNCADVKLKRDKALNVPVARVAVPSVMVLELNQDNPVSDEADRVEMPSVTVASCAIVTTLRRDKPLNVAVVKTAVPSEIVLELSSDNPVKDPLVNDALASVRVAT